MNWYKQRGGTSTGLTTLPTALMKQGNFSELPFPIYDPATTRDDGHGGLTRDPFPGNIIPPNRLSPLSQPFNELVPTATGPGIINNTVISSPSTPLNYLTYLLKFDHNIGSKIAIHASYYKNRFN